MKLIPLPNTVIITDFMIGERTVGSIILRNDNGKSHGIRPRWGKVYAVGEGVDDVKPGQWVLMKHGRWSRGFNVCLNDDDKEDVTKLWKVDYPDGVIVVTDEEPKDDSFSQYE